MDGVVSAAGVDDHILSRLVSGSGIRANHGVIVVTIREAEFEGLEALGIDSVEWQAVCAEAGGDTDAFHALEFVKEQLSGLVAILGKHRRSVRLFADLHHTRNVAADADLSGCRQSLLIVDHKAVAGSFELVPTDNDEAAANARYVENAGRSKGERWRINRDLRRLDNLLLRNQGADFVMECEVRNRDLHLRVEDEERSEDQARLEVGRVVGKDVCVASVKTDVRVGKPGRTLEDLDVVCDEVCSERLHGLSGEDRSKEVYAEGEAAQIVRPRRVLHDRRELDAERWRLVFKCRRIKHKCRRLTADVNGVVAGTAHECRLEERAGREHVDIVRTAAAIDLDGFDVGEVHNASGSGDVGIGNDERVPNRGANDDDRVDAGSAVDLHGCVLDIVVAVFAAAAKERCEIGDFVLVLGVLAQDEEGLEQEAIVPISAVEIQHCAVVVHLEAVVLVAAKDGERGRVSVGEIVGIDDRYSIRELERTVAGIGLQRNGRDRDIVVARTHVDDGVNHRVVRQECVRARESVDAHAIDFAVAEQVADCLRPIANCHCSYPLRTNAECVQRDLIRPVRAIDDQFIAARSSTRVVNREAGRVRAVEVDDVVFVQTSLGAESDAAVVERNGAGERCDSECARTHADESVDVVDDHHVVSVATLEFGVFKDAGVVARIERAFENGGSRPGVTAVAEREAHRRTEREILRVLGCLQAGFLGLLVEVVRLEEGAATHHVGAVCRDLRHYIVGTRRRKCDHPRRGVRAGADDAEIRSRDCTQRCLHRGCRGIPCERNSRLPAIVERECSAGRIAGNPLHDIHRARCFRCDGDTLLRSLDERDALNRRGDRAKEHTPRRFRRAASGHVHIVDFREAFERGFDGRGCCRSGIDRRREDIIEAELERSRTRRNGDQLHVIRRVMRAGRNEHASIAKNLADDEIVAEQTKVRVLGFYESVVTAGIDEHIEPFTAAHAVVACSAIQGVVELRTGQVVVTLTADEREHGAIEFHTACSDAVIAESRVDYESIALTAFAVQRCDGVFALANDIDCLVIGSNRECVGKCTAVFVVTADE